MDVKFKPTGHGNEVLECGEFAVSYNSGSKPMIPNRETALICNTKQGERKYLILIGDWREQYVAAIVKDGFGGALRVYNENKDANDSPWTTDSDDIVGIFEEILK